ncbi:polysaccharide deacetylase [candidate division KSB1 bacterium]|nr:MAG: polysaccharide deacetylase [candidate division KSB1 bacterium]
MGVGRNPAGIGIRMRRFLVIVIALWTSAAFADTLQVARRIAVTFDDLPAQRGNLTAITGITNGLVGFFEEHRLPAVGFVNGNKLNVKKEQGARAILLRRWISAGLELGNHTYSHPDANAVSLAEYQEDVLRGEQPLREHSGAWNPKRHYFRHPYLHMGASSGYQDSLNIFLLDHGYTIAPVTIDNADYMFGYAYDVAREQGNSALEDSVVAAYVPYMDSVFAFYERLSVETAGREIPQILLLHAHRLNAEYFSQIYNVLQRRGYSLITLEEALRDTVYNRHVPATKKGCSWIQRWRMAQGLPLAPEPDVPAFVEDIMKSRR